jgi:hypothetical protein
MIAEHDAGADGEDAAAQLIVGRKQNSLPLLFNFVE